MLQAICQAARKLAVGFAFFVAGVLLAWSSLVYVKLRTTRYGMLGLLPKLGAIGFSLEIALVGLAGAAIGAMTGLASMAVAYVLVAISAAIPLMRTWRTSEVFTEAFGPIDSSESRPYLLRRSCGARLPRVPEARVKHDIPFWTLADGQRQLLCDIWLPALEVPASKLGFVYLHGSAWTLLDKDCGTRMEFRHLAAQGHVVMDVAYRLYPETDIEGMVADAKRAVFWLKAHAAEYGVDPDRIVLGGGSAGGHIALLAAYTAGDARLTPAELYDLDTTVRGALGWYGPVDLGACYEHYEIATLAEMMPQQPEWNAPPPPIMRRLLGADAERLAFQNPPSGGRLDWMLGGSPAEVPDRYALLSPIAHVHSACPPTLLLQGRDDIIVPPEPALDLQEKLKSMGVAAAVLILPQADHGFDLLATDWSPAARKALWHAQRFLAWIAAGSGSAGARPTVAVRSGTPTPVT